MVTVVHGGPAAASRPGFAGSGLRAALIERGWAVFYPNPRGSFGQGERFAAANVRDLGYGDLRDVLTGIDAAVPRRAHRRGAARLDRRQLWRLHDDVGGNADEPIQGGGCRRGLEQLAGLIMARTASTSVDAALLRQLGIRTIPAVYTRSSAINYIKNVRTPHLRRTWESPRHRMPCAPDSQEFWHAALKAEGDADCRHDLPRRGPWPPRSKELAGCARAHRRLVRQILEMNVFRYQPTACPSFRKSDPPR